MKEKEEIKKIKCENISKFYKFLEFTIEIGSTNFGKQEILGNFLKANRKFCVLVNSEIMSRNIPLINLPQSLPRIKEDRILILM